MHTVSSEGVECSLLAIGYRGWSVYCKLFGQGGERSLQYWLSTYIQGVSVYC